MNDAAFLAYIEKSTADSGVTLKVQDKSALQRIVQLMS